MLRERDADDGRHSTTKEQDAMIPFLEFRLAPMNRDAGLAEKLAGVPEGTYVAFASAIEEIAGQELNDVLPAERPSVIEEQFNIMRINEAVRKYHDFSQNWFGKPTAETVMLLSRWDTSKTVY